jgi:ornithine decarboxylase
MTDPLAADRLARLPGPTPFLVLDLDRVATAYLGFAAELPGVDVHYAMKCNPDERVLRRLHRLGCRFEIASVAELRALVEIGVDPAEVLYSNPVKPAAHVAEAWRAGVWRFAVDGGSELAKLAEQAPGAAVYARLRTSPGGNTVPSEGKFGVAGDRAADLLRVAGRAGLRPHGLAFHVGSQTLAPAAWDAALRRAGQVLRELAADGIRLDLLDLGGGFPARYADAEPPPLAEFAAAIRAGIAADLPYRPATLAVEPGRALVAEAGVMVATVIGLAERAGRRWVHLDVGAFNGFMEALETGNRLRFPVTDSRGSALRVPAHLTGPTCDSQDTIMFDVPLSVDLAVNDRVFLGTAGAYTTSYASGFNGFAVPTTYAVDVYPLRPSGERQT